MKNTLALSIFVFATSLFLNANAYAEATRVGTAEPTPLPMLPATGTHPLLPAVCQMPAPKQYIEELSISSLDSIEMYATACGRTNTQISGKGRMTGQKNNTAFQVIIPDNYNASLFKNCIEQLNRGLIDRANIVLRGYFASIPVVSSFDPFAFAIQSQIATNYLYLTSCVIKR